MAAYLTLQTVLWSLLFFCLVRDWIDPKTHSTDALIVGITALAFLQSAWPMYLLITRQ